MKKIATVKTKFKEKFGIPRQSGLVSEATGTVVFEPEYRVREALRGIEEYSHLWLIWGFSLAEREDWSPTVRPPRLGGNRRMGVFATRSPFRPNSIGLSSVRLLDVIDTPDEGTVLIVGGVDMLDGTPIYDIKPYIAYTDSHPDAVSGFADGVRDYALEVVFPTELAGGLAPEDLSAITELLREDPRPHYQSDPDRVYGMVYGEIEVHFTVCDGILKVIDVNIP